MSISVCLEGPEGVGKTSQSIVLEKLLQDTTNSPILRVREPGGTMAGEAIRGILFMDDLKDMAPTTQMLLFSSARNELLEKKILPFMRDNPNGIVIGDRSWLSTLALQVNDGVSEQNVRSVQSLFMDSYPDKFFYIDLPAEESIIRVAAGAKLNPTRRNWRDELSLDQYRENRSRYLSLLGEFSDRITIVDGYEPMFAITYGIRKEIMKNVAPEEGKFLPGDMNGWIHENSKQGVIDFKQMKDEFELREQIREKLGFPSSDKLRAEMRSEWQQIGLVEGVTSAYKERRF